MRRIDIFTLIAFSSLSLSVSLSFVLSSSREKFYNIIYEIKLLKGEKERERGRERERQGERKRTYS